ncbi:unnamed protein product [Plasmodium vivax]|uniref:(malaria parasite P. vivax) hypothetical protein n=1 Tax=Plasmodium vivax TaxID=5855 RepID=A0A1G4ECG3_PLAVI|nr:unnamed protein product [Plasmodium vivax]SCA59759.1 VIR protein [Plasmodium vivax]
MADIGEHISKTSSYYYDKLSRKDHRSYDQNDETKCNASNSNLEGKYSSFKEFCMQLTGIFKNYSYISSSLSNKSIMCLTLNMWMHEQIYNMLKTKDEDDPRKIIDGIRDIWTNYTASTNCDIRVELSKKQDFLENKKLFDYTINYNNIVMHLATESHKCTQEYKDYIDEIQTIYKTQKGIHDSRPDYNYCEVLDNFEKINTQEKLAAVRCTQVQDRANHLVAERSAETYGSPGERGIRGQAGVSGLHMQQGSRGIVDSQEFQGPPTILPQAEDTPSTTPVAAGIPLVGVPVISYLLYKFTPVGSMFGSRARRRNPIGSNMFGGEHYNMEDMYQMGNDDHPMRDHIIGYHPV